jgi:hypothetical protein
VSDLAEKILEACREEVGDPSRPSSVDGILERLALPFAEHPDYRSEWSIGG